MNLRVYVCCFFLPIDDLESSEYFAKQLDDGEKARAKRFLSDQTRRQFVAAHGIKRLLLGKLLTADPRTLRFQMTSRGGKPILALPGDQGLRFNLSHTTGLVACAAAYGAEVGIDVEPANRNVERSLARHYFASDEADWLEKTPDEDRRAAFIKLWTLKEAVIKAVGSDGLVALNSFSVRPDPPQLLHYQSTFSEALFLHQWQPNVSHTAAIAVLAPHGTKVEIVESEFSLPFKA